MNSIKINYQKTKTDLCDIGFKYGTDKSSQLNKYKTNESHCHPYTLYYNSIFNEHKDKQLKICELGILKGGSLMMWRDYFKNAIIDGYDVNLEHINNFKDKYKNVEGINLFELDVRTHFELNDTYDIIIDDTTHDFYDQINIIKNSHKYLAEGGMMIIEDVFLSYDENYYLSQLKYELENVFEKHYFIEMNHQYKYSEGWNNDKILILLKKNNKLKTNKKMTIITPCTRPNNLLKCYQSIDFDYVDEWLIVYDGAHEMNFEFIQFDDHNDKIKQLIYYDPVSCFGNAQRNHALRIVKNQNTFIYFLDDDNLMHPELKELLEIADENRIYTFDIELHGSEIRKGDAPFVNQIDSLQILVDYRIIKNKKWIPYLYNADGYFIESVVKENEDKWIYVNNVLSFHNKIKSL